MRSTRSSLCYHWPPNPTHFYNSHSAHHHIVTTVVLNCYNIINATIIICHSVPTPPDIFVALHTVDRQWFVARALLASLPTAAANFLLFLCFVVCLFVWAICLRLTSNLHTQSPTISYHTGMVARVLVASWS